MAAENNNNDVMNINDPLDINELAALNDDISAEFIEQLQNQIAQNSTLIEKKSKKDVTTLFEEVSDSEQGVDAQKSKEIIANFDDNFIKKYKAKIEKQKNAQFEEAREKNKTEKKPEPVSEPAPITETIPEPQIEPQPEPPVIINSEPIETLTNGNIVEKPITKEQLEYNKSLDFLDDNVNYSKYVIYIDPENTEFIESLTVKERKNLINKILKEQDNIVITKKRLNAMQTYIKHAIIAILTIAIATPVIYFTINASLEATINNHRRSQTIFKTLYKEKGKIKNHKY